MFDVDIQWYVLTSTSKNSVKIFEWIIILHALATLPLYFFIFYFITFHLATIPFTEDPNY